MAVGDRGLASPYELPVCFVVLLDLSACAVHNQSAHKPTIHRSLFAAPGVTYLSPLSTDRGFARPPRVHSPLPLPPRLAMLHPRVTGRGSGSYRDFI